jgi:transposase
MEKIDFRTLSSNERFKLRKQGVRLIISGKKQNEVALFLGVRTSTVSTWNKIYKAEGLSGLKDKPKGPNSEDMKLLKEAQEKTIQKMIIDHMPDQLKFNYSLWTRKAVRELVQREFGITLAINTMGDYLRSWGFSPQKPKKQAYEQCSKKVKKWLDEEYPSIKNKAKEEGAEIHWGDETGVRNSSQHGRSYALKGKTPIKKTMAKRFSVNMISTVTNLGKVEFMIYTGTMNSEMLIKFLDQFIKGKTKKMYLILDNLRVHHSKMVKKWVEEHESKIALFYLPSYSPEKNPDEYLNCDLKYGLSEVASPKNQEQLRDNLENHMTMLKNNKERVVKYFKHPDIQYAA